MANRNSKIKKDEVEVKRGKRGERKKVIVDSGQTMKNGKNNATETFFHKYFNVAMTVLTVIIAAASLVSSYCAMYSSNKIAINNSALNFTYENFELKTKTTKEGIMFEVSDETIIQGGAEITIDVKVNSGQIASLYLVQKHKGEFVFTLLNDGSIQDKGSKIKSYETDLYFDMQKKEEIDNILIGSGRVYMLSEDINGQIYIDAIQIVGPILEESVNGNVKIYDAGADYEFSFIKNNQFVTIQDDHNIGGGWVSYKNMYPSRLKTIDIEELEHDLATIKEIYSRYKF